MTNEPRKVFRTNAFKVDEADFSKGEATVFWSLEPTYMRPGQFYIRKHELYQGGSWSGGVTPDNLNEREAIELMLKMEREAAQKYPPADPDYMDHMWMGNEYRKAPHITKHHGHSSGIIQERLRARKRPGLGLK